MKKVFSFILVIVCMISASLAAYAVPMNDLQKKDLADYGIMAGDPSGDLRLDDTITRAEAIKMLCVAGNLKTDNADAYSFPDVSNDHWAYNYIAAAKANKIVNGDENGNFNPENKVTNEELIKMAVCLVGFYPLADLNGGYPLGYITTASRMGLTTDMNFKTNIPAIRNDVGIIIYNALDVPLMKKITDDPNSFDYIVLDGSAGFDLVTLRKNLSK